MSYCSTPCKVCKNPIGKVDRGNFLFLAHPANLGKCVACALAKKRPS